MTIMCEMIIEYQISQQEVTNSNIELRERRQSVVTHFGCTFFKCIGIFRLNFQEWIPFFFRNLVKFVRVELSVISSIF